MIIAHVDMDCFFAACEEKYNLSLKGKPLIIGGLGKRGVVSTANYEARKYGVHSAQPMSKAKLLCPNGIYLESNYTLYQQESQAVMNVLKIFAKRFEQVSVDEAYLDITDFAKECNSLQEAGNKIQKQVFDETKLTCSVGISHSKRVSKIASDFKKPSGITVVENPKDFLKNLPVKKISGIGKKTNQRLNELGIFKIEDLAKANTFFLLDNFGKWIIEYQDLAKGNDFSYIKDKESFSKSVSRETTFPEDISYEECFNHIEYLIHQIYQDLGNYEFKTVSIKVRDKNFTTITRDYSFSFTNKDLNQIKKAALCLLKLIKFKEIRLLGIKLSNLTYVKNKQISLLNFT
jgi:DNA polymerase IV (archaeal DinB-like DNA polymerase)